MEHMPNSTTFRSDKDKHCSLVFFFMGDIYWYN